MISKEFKPYKIYRGKEITTLNEDKTEPLVEGIIYPNDYIFLVSMPKAGKTLLTQQLTCNLTTGKPFLGVFDIPRPCKVWYFLTEGKIEDIKERFIRIGKTEGLNVDNLKIITTFFPYNTEKGIAYIREVDKQFKDEHVDMIIVDSLYLAVKGPLSSDETIGGFTQVMRWLQEKRDCAIWVAHHFKKSQRGQDGKIYDTTDADTYGSQFIAGGVDSLIRLEKWKKDPNNKKDLVMACETQRSDKVAENIRIRLMSPSSDELHFVPINKHDTEKHHIIQLFKTYKQIDMHQLLLKGDVGRNTAYAIIKELCNEGLIQKHGDKRPVIYELIEK